jgi:hypothetical protein
MVPPSTPVAGVVPVATRAPPAHNAAGGEGGGSGLPFPLWGWSGSTTLLSGRQCSGGVEPPLHFFIFCLSLFIYFLTF